MLSIVQAEAPESVLHLSFRRAPLAERSGRPLLIGMGDPLLGPLVGLFYDRPATEEELQNGPDLTPAHSHSSDTFRVCLKGDLIVGPSHYGPGQFRLQEAGRAYGRDGDAPHMDGNWRVIVFADRRGCRVRPTNPEMRKAAEAEEARTLVRLAPAVRELFSFDDPGRPGLVVSTGELDRVGSIDGGFSDFAQWLPLGDDTRVGAALLGPPDCGSLLVLSRTSMAARVSPSFVTDSDVARVVVNGSCRLGDRVLEAGDIEIGAGGSTWPETVAGPDGVDLVTLVAERSYPLQSVDVADRSWQDALRAITESLVGTLGTNARNAADRRS